MPRPPGCSAAPKIASATTKKPSAEPRVRGWGTWEHGLLLSPSPEMGCTVFSLSLPLPQEEIFSAPSIALSTNMASGVVSLTDNGGEKSQTNVPAKELCYCQSEQQLSYVPYPLVFHLFHPTVILLGLKRCLFLLYTNLLLSFSLLLLKIYVMEEAHSNLLQLFLSCHQGDAARRASAEPRESGNGGRDWGGGRDPLCICIYTCMHRQAMDTFTYACHKFIWFCMTYKLGNRIYYCYYCQELFLPLMPE